jgi:two-component system cell cycle response regulator DivK
MMATSPQRTSEPVATARRKVVLLVQPSRDDGLEMYAEFLRYSGLAPVAVSNATDALTFASEADVIVTGIVLDGPMDGVELVSRLRGDEGTMHKPIIVLTTSAWPRVQERAEHAGCNVFLSKPCLPDALLRDVRLLLPSTRGFTATRIPRTQMTEHRRASTR